MKGIGCSSGTSTICARSERIGSSVKKLNRRFPIIPILIYQQNVEGEGRYVYYGESNIGRLLALVITERKGRIRVVTAYDLNAGQKRDYLTRRLEEN